MTAQEREAMIDRAALAVRAQKSFWGWGPDDLKQLQDILRQCIAGVPPEAVEATLMGLFDDLVVAREVLEEEVYGPAITRDPDAPCPF